MSNQQNTEEKNSLTKVELREIEGFESFNDEEAEEALRTIDIMAELIYDCYKQELLKKKKR